MAGRPEVLPVLAGKDCKVVRSAGDDEVDPPTGLEDALNLSNEALGTLGMLENVQPDHHIERSGFKMAVHERCAGHIKAHRAMVINGFTRILKTMDLYPWQLGHRPQQMSLTKPDLQRSASLPPAHAGHGASNTMREMPIFKTLAESF